MFYFFNEPFISSQFAKDSYSYTPEWAVFESTWDDFSDWTRQDKYFKVKPWIIQNELWENYGTWTEKYDMYFQHVNQMVHEEDWDNYSHWVSIDRLHFVGFFASKQY